MKFVILTQYYPPETGAPQNRLSDLARRLTAAGHDVTVLTAKPNYPRGEIHADYRRGFWNERHEGRVRVIHCWLVAVKSKRVAMRLLNYFSFVFASALTGLLKLGHADFLIVESPPLFLGLSAWLLSRAKGARMIFNVSDLFPATAVALGYVRDGLLLRLMYALEGWCYRRSALVTGQTQGIVDDIRGRFPDRSVHLLTNGVDTADFANVVHTVGATFTVGYAGILGHAQGLPAVLDAARRLRDQSVAVQFQLFGDGPLRDDLEAQARALDLGNVEFAGHRSRREILDAMTKWDAGLVPLVNTPLMAGALPSKMFEIMAAGLPVVLSAPEGEASRLVARAQAGVHVAPEDPVALAHAVEELASGRDAARMMGRNGRAYVLTHYDRAAIAEAFLASVAGFAEAGS
jgi:glycosyltransferase involved in cell wall biosynthesis